MTFWNMKIYPPPGGNKKCYLFIWDNGSKIVTFDEQAVETKY